MYIFNVRKNLSYLMMIFIFYYREIREFKNVKLVVDVIRYDSFFIKKVLLFVCGNVLVCDIVEDVRYVAFGIYDRYKVSKFVNEREVVM